MYRFEIPSGIGFYNVDILIPFENFDVEIFYFFYEPKCHSFRGITDNFHHLVFYKDGKININYKGQNRYIDSETVVYFPPQHKHNETILEENITKYHIEYSIIQKKNSKKRIVNRNDLSKAETDELKGYWIKKISFS